MSEIDRLRAENERLREALAPFAREATLWADYSNDEYLVEPFPGVESRITVGDLRRAQAELGVATSTISEIRSYR